METGELETFLSRAKSVCVLTGAGISQESGVPTFRGPGGLWKQYRPEELATPEAFARDPMTVWEWYAWRREIIGRAQPNAAHFALRSPEMETGEAVSRQVRLEIQESGAPIQPGNSKPLPANDGGVALITGRAGWPWRRWKRRSDRDCTAQYPTGGFDARSAGPSGKTTQSPWTRSPRGANALR